MDAALRRILAGRRRAALISALGGVVHQACEISVPIVIGAIVDRAIEPSDGTALVRWLVVLAVLFVVLNGAYRVQLLVGMRAMLDAEHEVRMDVCARVLAPGGLRLRGGDRTSGALVSVASTDAQGSALVLQALSLAAGAASALVIATVALLNVSVALGALVLLGSPPMVWLLHRAAGPLHRRSTAEQARVADAVGVAGDLVRGARVLQGIGAERAAGERYRAVSRASLRATLRSASSASALTALNTLVGGLFLALVAYVATRLAAAGTISVGELVAAVGLTQFLIGPLERIGYVAEILARARACGTRAAEVVAAPPAVRGGAAPLPATAAGALAVHGLTGSPGDGPDLDVAPGEHVGIAAGDVALAARLVDLLARRGRDGGARVLLDGRDLAGLALDGHHRTVLVSDHDADLFDGSVAENVRAVAPDVGAARLDRVLAAATVDEVAEVLPGGLEAGVGERGLRLSGGQRQRVALARVLAADPPVLVLHEPTTAVDAATEARVAAGIRALRAGRTTLLVTTSPALLAACDRVVFLPADAAPATGTHAGLAAADDRYRAAVLA